MNGSITRSPPALDTLSPDYQYKLWEKARRASRLAWSLTILLSAPAVSFMFIPSLNQWGEQWISASPLLNAFRGSKHFEQASFSESLKFVLQEEGGYIQNQSEPGGETNYGISANFLAQYGAAAGVKITEVKELSAGDRTKLYRFIWKEANCGHFFRPLDTVCLDTATNFGITGWWTFLEEVEKEVENSPKAAAITIAKSRSRYREKRVKENPSQKAFLAGWQARDSRLNNYALAFTETSSKEENQFSFPLPGQSFSTATITSDYGWRTIKGEPNFHEGLDFGASFGTPLIATEAGQVTAVFSAQDGNACGNGVKIQAKKTPELELVYCHLQKVTVHAGANVLAGTPIGTVGSSGRSSGPHLHFAIYINGASKNPTTYLQKGG